jgi:hypothetical protein
VPRGASSNGSLEVAALGDLGPPENHASFDLSPDDGRVVAEVRKEGATTRSTLSLLDASRTIVSALTAGEMDDTDPRFGPDGDVAFARNTGQTTGIVETGTARMSALESRPCQDSDSPTATCPRTGSRKGAQAQRNARPRRADN